MQGNEVDLLFPSRAIEPLQNLRTEKWENLIRSISGLDPVSPEKIAFVLMMVRIGGCASCQADSFRAMRGCILCSSASIKRYKGDDQTLIDQYQEAKNDVDKYLKEV